MRGKKRKKQRLDSSFFRKPRLPGPRRGTRPGRFPPAEGALNLVALTPMN